jgi:hypothetical protein
MAEKTSALVGATEGRSRFAKRKWEHNIKMNLKRMGWEVVDRIHMAQDRDQRPALVNTIINFRFP